VPNRAAYLLTVSQREHLGMLLDAGALDRETAKSMFDHPLLRSLNPNVVGILIDKGFADKRVRGAKGHRITVYWLTAGGVAVARELAGVALSGEAARG
jgi:hypothetical protein